MKFRPGLTAQTVTHFVAAESAHGVSVDGEKHVAGFETGLGRWRSLLGLGDVSLFVFALSDVRAYASELAGGDGEEIFLHLFGYIFSVGVDFIEHGVDGRRNRLVGVD